MYYILNHYSRLLELSYIIKSMNKRYKIKLFIRPRDHENIAHLHFSYKGKDYRYYLAGDYFQDHTSKPCNLDKNISDAVRNFCKNNYSALVAQYNLGKTTR